MMHDCAMLERSRRGDLVNSVVQRRRLCARCATGGTNMPDWPDSGSSTRDFFIALLTGEQRREVATDSVIVIVFLATLNDGTVLGDTNLLFSAVHNDVGGIDGLAAHADLFGGLNAAALAFPLYRGLYCLGNPVKRDFFTLAAPILRTPLVTRGEEESQHARHRAGG